MIQIRAGAASWILSIAETRRHRGSLGMSNGFQVLLTLSSGGARIQIPSSVIRLG